MANRVEIEGSEERARDRGEDTFFTPFFAGKQQDFLTDPDVVDAVVASFMSEVLGVSTRYVKDEVDEAGAKDAVQKICDRYAAIFMGQSADYAPTGWNRPDGLGLYLVNVAGIPESKEDAVKAVLLRTAASYLNEVVNPFAADEIDDEAAKFRTDAAKEDLVTLLLGLPGEEPEV